MPRFGRKAFTVRHDYIHVYRKTAAFGLMGLNDGPVETLWSSGETGSNELASAKSRQTFGEQFATPKPEPLLKRIVELTTQAGDLVLDCFAGSGTTAAVAHKLGRRWIAVEMEQNTVERYHSLQVSWLRQLGLL